MWSSSLCLKIDIVPSIMFRKNMRTATHLNSSSLSLPPDSYIYRIIPISDGLTFASISSDDSLRLFNANTLQLTHGEPFTKAHDGVTCLERLSTDPNCILTAGRDAAVRCWDSRSRGTTFELNDRKLILSVLNSLQR